ncbi:hypothetical protein NDN08_006523 [Rhodosorus marinus]|uniref:SnoaL-like domain-containing protein n=1 Tax=Rhodosorus marinus TaxID=101924 RepID=A0AAV8UHV5_9RHOD|nr:hypothetical protein NDN08_006523 [Rhodosorus marinus]
MAFLSAKLVFVDQCKGRSSSCPRLAEQFNVPKHTRAIALKCSESGEGSEDEQNPSPGLKPRGRLAETVSKYFASWSARDLDECIQYFAPDVVITDTFFEEPFVGIEGARELLTESKNLFPDSFRFVLDSLTDGDTRVAARWHVESNGGRIPNANGMSFWTASEDGLIASEYTVVEPVFKTGNGIPLFYKAVGPFLKQ